MKVQELIDELTELDPKMEVIMTSDGEGNNHSPLDVISIGIYTPDSTWSGEVHDPEWSASDACMEQQDWDEMLMKPRCLVLWPTN